MIKSSIILYKANTTKNKIFTLFTNTIITNKKDIYDNLPQIYLVAIYLLLLECYSIVHYLLLLLSSGSASLLILWYIFYIHCHHTFQHNDIYCFSILLNLILIRFQLNANVSDSAFFMYSSIQILYIIINWISCNRIFHYMYTLSLSTRSAFLLISAQSCLLSSAEARMTSSIVDSVSHLLQFLPWHSWTSYSATTYKFIVVLFYHC